MSDLRSSSSVSLVMVMVFLATSAWAQSGNTRTRQNIQPNFYITTPQTGEQTIIGTDSTTQQVVKTSARAADSDMNFYIPQNTPSSRNKQASSNRAASTRATSNNASTQKATIQQVSYSPVNASQIGSRQSESRTAASGHAYHHTQPRQIQQTYPNYVSAATANRQSAAPAKQGLMSKLFHKHPHTAAQPAVQPRQASHPSQSISPSKNDGATQTGIASWYGKGFHGGKTANGERYNMDSMTAAHKTLPFGTMVKVRNERNGQECVVRINNRGPFTKGRIIDLSRAAARELGMINSGVAKVSMRVIGKSSS